MPGLYEIEFSPDEPVKEFAGSRGNYYEFEDQSHLDMETTPVWCHHCGKITHGEKIEPLAEIDKKLADLNDPSSELYKFSMRSLLPGLDELMPRDKFRLDLIETAKKRRAWRAQRLSEPKCILCGSTSIFAFPLNQQVPNPAGQGTVEMSVVGMCSTRFNEWFFTPEGDRIPRDTKPTYWHHPLLDKEPEEDIQQMLHRLRSGMPIAPTSSKNRTPAKRWWQFW
jgi:hypothetical protein